MAKTNKSRGRNSRNRKPVGDPRKSPRSWEKQESHDMRKDYDKRVEHESSDNDVRWYAANPQLLSDFASIPYGYPLGMQLNTNIGTLDSNSVPGVMALRFEPMIGDARTETSPVNIAMRNLFSIVRKYNSGGVNYDAPDMMLFLLAMDSVVMFHAWMRRAYGVLAAYSVKNRFYPDAIISAMGLDPVDLRENYAQFRGYINIFAKRASALALPGTLSYFARHAWMCDNIYVDSATSGKAQTYVYSPGSLLKFELSGNPAVGALGRVPILNRPDGTIPNYTVSQLMSIGDELLNPLITNQDFNIMSGDILHAFGESNVIRLSPVPDDYLVLPVYSQEVLSQIENASVIWTGLPGGITQTTQIGTGYLVSPAEGMYFVVPVGPGYTSGSYDSEVAATLLDGVNGKKLLNMHMDNVTPGDTMVATRLSNCITIPPTATFTLVSGSTSFVFSDYMLCNTIQMPTVASEYISGAFVLSYVFSGGSQTTLWTPVYSTIGTTISDSDSPGTIQTAVSDVLTALSMLSQFDWHFGVYPTVACISSTAVRYAGPRSMFQDLDNYTSVDAATLTNIAQVALLSEFSFPMMQ